jgi:hypothetical protein
MRRFAEEVLLTSMTRLSKSLVPDEAVRWDFPFPSDLASKKILMVVATEHGPLIVCVFSREREYWT